MPTATEATKATETLAKERALQTATTEATDLGDFPAPIPGPHKPPLLPPGCPARFLPRVERLRFYFGVLRSEAAHEALLTPSDGGEGSARVGLSSARLLVVGFLQVLPWWETLLLGQVVEHVYLPRLLVREGGRGGRGGEGGGSRGRRDVGAWARKLGHLGQRNTRKLVPQNLRPLIVHDLWLTRMTRQLRFPCEKGESHPRVHGTKPTRAGVTPPRRHRL